MNELRIIFMGTPEFAVPSLEILLEHGYNVVAVVTAPDKPQGRGQKIDMSPVKVSALKHNLPVLQPTNLKSPEFIAGLRSLNANLQIVVAFRMLPEAVWSMSELGTFKSSRIIVTSVSRCRPDTLGGYQRRTGNRGDNFFSATRDRYRKYHLSGS
nr:Formyl transferase [uncultured bacterium]